MTKPMSEIPIGERLTGIAYDIKSLATRQEEMKIDNAAKHLDLKLEITNKTTELKSEISDIKSDLKSRFVTKIEFRTVQLITYGFVSIIVSAVVIAAFNVLIKAFNN